MSDITLSAGVRQNLLSLQNTADLMATTQSRLATGKKVNSALDNPTNFFTSQSLNNRASDLSSLLDSMSNGMKTLEAADNGLTAITKTIESMQATVRQARQDSSFKATSFGIDTATLEAASTQQTISFTGGEVGNTAVNVDLLSTVGTGAATAGTFAGGAMTAMTVEAGTAATAGAVTATFGSALTFDDPGDQLNFSVAIDGGATASITIDATSAGAVGNNDAVIDDIAELQAAIAAEIDAEGTYANGVDYTISNDGTDITISSATTGAASNVTLSSVGVVDGGGGDTLTNTSGLSDGGNTGVAAGTSDSITFDIAVDGGSATSVTIDNSVVAGVGNNDAVIDDAAELAAAINAALTTAGVTGATAADNGSGGVDFTSGTTGASSAVAISSVAVNNNNATTALAETTGLTGGTAAAGADAGLSVLKTVDALVTEINADTNLTGKIQASNDNGKLRVENLSTSDLTVTGIDAGGDVDGGVGTSDVGGNTVRQNLTNQFNELRDQLNKLSDDASFNGINLLQGDNLKLTFNETSTSTIDIQAKDADGNIRAVSTSTLSISSATGSEFATDGSLDTRLDGLADALSTLRTQASDFGSNLSIVQNRTEFTNNMINTLETGADNLVLADTNMEAANMLALQTRQQLSLTALSLASQSDQAVMRLF
jgi:flagellin-like hook-associated protein FlgL